MPHKTNASRNECTTFSQDLHLLSGANQKPVPLLASDYFGFRASAAESIGADYPLCSSSKSHYCLPPSSHPPRYITVPSMRHRSEIVPPFPLFSRLNSLKFKVPQHQRRHFRDFHERQLSSGTAIVPRAKGNPERFFSFPLLVVDQPALRFKALWTLEQRGMMMHHPWIDAEHCARREIFPAEGEARSRDDAGQVPWSGRVHAQSFLHASLEIRQLCDLGMKRDFRERSRIELCLD